MDLGYLLDFPDLRERDVISFGKMCRPTSASSRRSTTMSDSGFSEECLNEWRHPASPQTGRSTTKVPGSGSTENRSKEKPNEKMAWRPGRWQPAGAITLRNMDSGLARDCLDEKALYGSFSSSRSTTTPKEKARDSSTSFATKRDMDPSELTQDFEFGIPNPWRPATRTLRDMDPSELTQDFEFGIPNPWRPATRTLRDMGPSELDQDLEFGIPSSCRPATKTLRDMDPSELTQDFEFGIPNSGRPSTKTLRHVDTSELAQSSEFGIPTFRRTLELCRLKALALLKQSEDVFFLETFLVDDYLLDVRMTSRDGLTYAVTIKPWSMTLGRCASEVEFRNRLRMRRAADNVEVKQLLSRPSTDFNPQRLVRLILVYCTSKGLPIIVSSSFANIIGNWRRKRLLHYLVFGGILAGPQTCAAPGCLRPVSAVVVDEEGTVKTVYCSGHALAVDDNKVQLLLYIPLLVSITAHEENIVVSTMDVEEFYGRRHDNPSQECTSREHKRSVSFPMRWTPILKLKQPRKIKAKKPTSMLFETCYNISYLNGGYPILPKGPESCGAIVGHSLASQLFEIVLEKCKDVCPLESLTSLENLPYKWNVCH